jgi:hypothetical protein
MKKQTQNIVTTNTQTFIKNNCLFPIPAKWSGLPGINLVGLSSDTDLFQIANKTSVSK